MCLSVCESLTFLSDLYLFDVRTTVFVENQKANAVSESKTDSLSPSPAASAYGVEVLQHTNRLRAEKAAIETFTSPVLKNANRAEWSSYLTKE